MIKIQILKKIQTVITGTIILFVPLSIFASERFQNYHKMSSQDQAALSKIFSATFSSDFGSMNCTSTFISNDGMFITAAHCLQKCQQDDPRLEENDEDVQKQTSRLFSKKDSYLRINWREKKGTKTCELKVNGANPVKAKLLFSGTGNLWPFFPSKKQYDISKDSALLKKWQSLVVQGYGIGGDYAILQLEGKPKTQCLNLSEESAIEQESQHTISYPCIGDNDPQSLTPYYVKGANVTHLAQELKDEYNMKDLMNDNGVLLSALRFSSVPVSICSSGSSILDRQFRIKGIASAEFPSHARGNSLVAYLDVNHIKKVLKIRSWSEITTCNQ